MISILELHLISFFMLSCLSWLIAVLNLYSTKIVKKQHTSTPRKEYLTYWKPTSKAVYAGPGYFVYPPMSHLFTESQKRPL